MRRGTDTLTGDLFEVPAPPSALPGSMGYSLAVRRLMSDAIKASPYNTAEIAARMSDLTGQTITEHQLHAWTAPSREAWRMPLEFVPAFEVAAESTTLTSWLASVRGGRLLLGRETLAAELGRLEHQREEAARHIKRIKKIMGGAR